MMMMMMNCFCGMVDQRKAFSFISSQDLCQKISSPSIWICTEPEFRLWWMKLCSSDNHNTTAPYITTPLHHHTPLHHGAISFFFIKNIKIFQWLSKSKFLSFTTKVNPNNAKETKSDIFSLAIFKSDTISFLYFFIKKH